MTIKASDIAALTELFAASGWEELHVEVEGLQLFLSTNPNARLSDGSRAAAAAVAAPLAAAGRGVREKEAPAATTPGLAAAPGLARQPEPADEAAVPASWVAITAPNLGTFYRAPKPGGAPYVSVGQSVTEQTEVCMLEVMKLFTAVRAGTAGVVRRVCAEDAQLVEFGQVLFYIEPAVGLPAFTAASELPNAAH